MKPDTTLSLFPAVCSRRSALLTIAGAAAQLAGCGGGGTGVAGLSSGGTGSFTSGTVTGFGSIIVNGIRYDDSSAALLPINSTANASSLKLGMVVTIEGSNVAPAASTGALPTATATRISYGSEWEGPVGNITTTSFDILGHTVDVLTSTIFSGNNGTSPVTKIADLNTSCYAEVYGYVNQTNGRLQASRIEVTTTVPTEYKLTGTITSITGNTALLGATTITWSPSYALPTGVTSGSFVRVILNNTSTASAGTATRIELVTSLLGNLSSTEDYEAEIHGTITAYTSNTSFSVNGIPVNATTAQITGTLAAGVTVEITGSIRAGQLIATQVEVETSTQIASQTFEFYGQISNLNNSTYTFVLRGLSFSYDTTTILNGVNFALNSAPMVKVKAIQNANGQLFATEIDLQT